ncbi:MAG: hypothetical protein E7812_14460 [Phenylobacterium sp.]|nr:MAG: hypothetical protein E7812_14460 [Phenylobacterium sp.]
MSEPPIQRFWFRPRTFGIGATPVTWEGWLVTLAFVVLITVTVSYGAPWGQGPRAVLAYLHTRHNVGFHDIWPQHAPVVMAVVVEIAGFIALVRWKTSGPWLPH